jgi:hypothetical protein
MKTMAWKKLTRLKMWQLALLLLFLGLTAAVTISQTIRLLAALNAPISAVGGIILVAWAFVIIERRRDNDDWLGS